MEYSEYSMTRYALAIKCETRILELERLVMALSERIYAAHCVLARNAERKQEAMEMSMQIEGVGPTADIVTNAAGGKQSHIPYRCDLLPPLAILTVANVLAEGAAKYGDNNWRAIPVSDHINHAMSHLFAYQAGDDQDEHMAHAATRLLFALELVESQWTRRYDITEVDSQP